MLSKWNNWDSIIACCHSCRRVWNKICYHINWLVHMNLLATCEEQKSKPVQKRLALTLINQIKLITFVLVFTAEKWVNNSKIIEWIENIVYVFILTSLQQEFSRKERIQEAKCYSASAIKANSSYSKQLLLNKQQGIKINQNLLRRFFLESDVSESFL